MIHANALTKENKESFNLGTQLTNVGTQLKDL